MFGEFSYILYLAVFTLVPIAIIWIRYFTFLRENVRVIFVVTFIGIVFTFIANPFAGLWKPWTFSDDRILGLWLLGFPIEDLLFAILVSFTIASAVLVFARKIEN